MSALNLYLGSLCRARLKDVVKDAEYEITAESTYDDFLEALNSKDEEQTGSIPDSNRWACKAFISSVQREQVELQWVY